MLIVFTIIEACKSAVIINPFDVPESLSKEGYNGNVAARQLLDQISLIQNSVRDSVTIITSTGKFQTFDEQPKIFFSSDVPEVDFEVPTTGISFNKVVNFLKSYIGIEDEKISGEIIINKNEAHIVIRHNANKLIEKINKDSINLGMHNIALKLFEKSYPISYARFLHSKSKFNECRNYLESKLHSLNNTQRVEAYILISDSFLYQYTELNRYKNFERIFYAGMAEKNLQDLLKINPDHLEALHILATIKEIRRDTVKAVSLYERIIKKNSSYAPAYISLGIRRENEGKILSADSLFKLALLADPNNGDAYETFGQNQEKQGKWLEADSIYRKLLTINPNYFRLYKKLGFTSIKLNRWGEGEYFYNKDLVNDPTDIAVKFNLSIAKLRIGEIYNDMNKINQADSLLKIVIKTNSKYPLAHQFLGRSKFRQGNFKDAKNDFKSEIAISPNDPSPHFYLGFSNEKLGNIPEAIKNYKQAIKINKKEYEYTSQLMKLFLQKGKPDSAEHYIKNYLRVNESAYAYSDLGVVKYSKGDIIGGNACFSLAESMGLNNSDLYYNIGLTKEIKGDFNAARSYYNKAITHGSERAKTNLKNLHIRVISRSEPVVFELQKLKSLDEKDKQYIVLPKDLIIEPLSIVNPTN